MNNSSLIFICASLWSFSCVREKKIFQDPSADPIRKALVKGRVLSYITYESVSGQSEKIDTVILDSRGNIVSIKNIGCCHSLIEMSYDSMGRLVSSYQESDITNFIKFTYEIIDEKRLITTEFLSDEEDGSSKMVYQTTTEFDEFGRPVSRTEIHLTNPDTLRYIYLYRDDRLVKEVLLPEKDSIYVNYVYANGNLVRKRSVSARDLYMYEDEFFSPETGLRDSTLASDGEFLNKIYFRYYYKD